VSSLAANSCLMPIWSEAALGGEEMVGVWD